MIDYQREIENQQTTQQIERDKKSDLQKHLSAFCPPESQPDPDFFQDDNDIKIIKKKSYRTTMVKARNLLTNASYRRHKAEDFSKANLTIDTVSVLVQNLSPIALYRKLETETEKNNVKLIWDKCLPAAFTSFILREKTTLSCLRGKLLSRKQMNLLKNSLKKKVEHLDLKTFVDQ